MAERIDLVQDLNNCGVLNGDPLYPLIIRARDEIVALRTHTMRQAEMIRAEALEDAAQLCEQLKKHAKGKGQPGFTEAFEDLIDTLAGGIRGLRRLSE